MKYWITADTHFGHKNIIKYCNRPFRNISGMNYELVRRWNERVKSEDIVFFNGDFCFKGAAQNKSKYWEEQLNGKIIFIQGNHDRNNTTKTPIKNMELFFGGREIFITHRPKDFNSEIQLNLVGHIHEKWKIRRLWTGELWVYLYNVGVDVHNFYPITLKEAIDNFNKIRNTENVIITSKRQLGIKDNG